MSREKMLYSLDRVPRYASLLGLLGLVGIAGVLEPELYRFSALSFLSFLSFFRYFRRFIDPDYGPTRASVPFIALALFVGAISPWLISVSSMFGFVGFAGCCGLFDPGDSVTHAAVQ